MIRSHVKSLLLILSVIINYILLIRMLLPLRFLYQRATRLAEGDYQALQQHQSGIPEIEGLRRAILAMAKHAQRAQSQSRTYADAFTRSQEAERTRIARELHDDTTQTFIAIGQSIDLVSDWIESDPTQALELLKLARNQTADAVAALRTLIADLRPPALDELGLVTALEMLADRYENQSLFIEIQGIKRRLDEDIELTLFRCTQEALTNAQKHGGATKVNLQLVYATSAIELVIQDNGTGFTVPENLENLAHEGHYGLMGLQERVANLYGEIHIRSSHKGTVLKIHIPYTASKQPTDTVRDPVCDVLIEPQEAYSSIVYNGNRYFFCCPVCHGAFHHDPSSYLVRQ